MLPDGAAGTDLVHPHPLLPLFPRRLLSLAEGRAVHVEGVGEVLPGLLATSRLSDFPVEHHAAYLAGARRLAKSILNSRGAQATLGRIKLQVEPAIRVSDLLLTERARAALERRPSFRSSGPWRLASVADLINPNDGQTRLGTRLTLALLLAAEASPATTPGSPQPMSMPLEVMMARLVAESIHSGRSTEIVLRAHGWNGHGKESLASIADEIGLTHERARQILRSAERTLHDHGVDSTLVDMLTRAVGILSALCPITSKKAGMALVEYGLCRVPFSPDGLLDAAKFFGVSLDGIERWIWDGNAFARRNDARPGEVDVLLLGNAQATTASAIHRDARRLLANGDPFSAAETPRLLAQKHGASVSAVQFVLEEFAQQ